MKNTAYRTVPGICTIIIEAMGFTIPIVGEKHVDLSLQSLGRAFHESLPPRHNYLLWNNFQIHWNGEASYNGMTSLWSINLLLLPLNTYYYTQFYLKSLVGGCLKKLFSLLIPIFSAVMLQRTNWISLSFGCRLW